MSSLIMSLDVVSLSVVGLGFSWSFNPWWNGTLDRGSADPALIEVLLEQLLPCGPECLQPSCPVCVPCVVPLYGYLALFIFGVVWGTGDAGPCVYLARQRTGTQQTQRIVLLAPEETDFAEPLSVTLDVVGWSSLERCRCCQIC